MMAAAGPSDNNGTARYPPSPDSLILRRTQFGDSFAIEVAEGAEKAHAPRPRIAEYDFCVQSFHSESSLHQRCDKLLRRPMDQQRRVHCQHAALGSLCQLRNVSQATTDGSGRGTAVEVTGEARGVTPPKASTPLQRTTSQTRLST